jgi:hypothetical protein
MRVRDELLGDGEPMASESLHGHSARRMLSAGPSRLLINSLKLLIIPDRHRDYSEKPDLGSGATGLRGQLTAPTR